MSSRHHHNPSSNKYTHKNQHNPNNNLKANKKIYHSPNSYQIISIEKKKRKNKSHSKCSCSQKKNKCNLKIGPSGYLNSLYNDRQFPSHYLDYGPDLYCSTCQHIGDNGNLQHLEYYNNENYWKPAETDRIQPIKIE